MVGCFFGGGGAVLIEFRLGRLRTLLSLPPFSLLLSEIIPDVDNASSLSLSAMVVGLELVDCCCVRLKISESSDVASGLSSTDSKTLPLLTPLIGERNPLPSMLSSSSISSKLVADFGVG